MAGFLFLAMGQKATKSSSKKNMKASFESYARQNCILNEYSFWKEASEFQKRRHWTSKLEMAQVAKAIFDKFITEGGEQEVCIGIRTLPEGFAPAAGFLAVC